MCEVFKVCEVVGVCEVCGVCECDTLGSGAGRSLDFLLGSPLAPPLARAVTSGLSALLLDGRSPPLEGGHSTWSPLQSRTAV